MEGIIVDLDDVIASFCPSLINFLNQLYDANLTMEKIRGWNIWEYGNLTREQYVEGVRSFKEAGLFRKLPLVRGAKEALVSLKRKNLLWIVTYRSEEIKEDTLEWLSENSIPYDGIFFTESKPKFEICKILNPDFAIDDSPNSLDLSEICRLLLFDRPWNQDLTTCPNIERVYNWQEILEKINQQT